MTQSTHDIELYDGETLDDASTVQLEDDNPESLIGGEVDDDLHLSAGEVHG